MGQEVVLKLLLRQLSVEFHTPALNKGHRLCMCAYMCARTHTHTHTHKHCCLCNLLQLIAAVDKMPGHISFASLVTHWIAQLVT